MRSTNPVVSLSARHDIYHSGYLISAAAAGGADFRIDAKVFPLVPLIQAGGITRAIDLADSSSHFHRPALEECDLYLKRSYDRAEVPAAYAAKVRPFGLNYSCRTARALWTVLRLSLRSGFSPRDAKSFIRSPLPGGFEAPPSNPPDPRILFSTRLWPRNQFGPNDDPAQINGFRIELVRHLRQAFGARFVGGLIPSRDTFEVFPDLKTSPQLIVNIPHRRTAYARFSRGPAIGIYTRGVHGSNAFKLAEYLASSKCIVGQSLAHELPECLGESHRVAETVDEIVAECDRLLTDTKRLNEVRRMSWDYYCRMLRYDRRLETLLAL